jgi:hypothetical protein
MKIINRCGQNCIKTSALFIALLSAGPAMSHITSHTNDKIMEQNADRHRSEISILRAKKLTRHFLYSRGFTRNTAAGGATIGDIEALDAHWKVRVDLRHYSATKKQTHWVFVNKSTGLVSEALPAENSVAQIHKK